MNVCAIFECYTIPRLVYTGIILLELSTVCVYKWLFGVLDSISEPTKGKILNAICPTFLKKNHEKMQQDE